jgi:hypothetical protein
MKNHPGGVTLLAINLSRTDPQTLNVPEKSMRYTLTATDLMSHSVQLNGKDLQLAPNGDVPTPAGLATAKGALTLPAASITSSPSETQTIQPASDSSRFGSHHAADFLLAASGLSSTVTLSILPVKTKGIS